MKQVFAVRKAADAKCQLFHVTEAGEAPVGLPGAYFDVLKPWQEACGFLQHNPELHANEEGMRYILESNRLHCKR